MLYQRESAPPLAHQATPMFWAPSEEDDASAAQLQPDEREFATAIVEGVERERERIDAEIRGASANWRLERMSQIDRNILRLATYELIAHADVPKNVILNEAIELAKTFGDEGSSSFVNGVLDRIAATVRSGQS